MKSINLPLQIGLGLLISLLTPLPGHCFYHQRPTPTIVESCGRDSPQDYGLFGQLPHVTRPQAKANAFGCSTKYQGDAGDLLFYGYRYYNASTGRWLSRDPLAEVAGPDPYVCVINDAVNHFDVVGLLAATVISLLLDPGSHLSAEKNGTYHRYIEASINSLPPKTSDFKPAASITATLDDTFTADIRASTILSRDRSLTLLQMSTDLHGTITLACPCPFKRVRANWRVSAAVSGTAGNAHADFDGYKAVTAWNRSPDLRIGSSVRNLDSSYRAKFAFVLGQGWFDKSTTVPTTSHVIAQATFECID